MIPEGWREAKIKDIAKIDVGRDLVEDRFSRTKTASHQFPIYSNTVEALGLYGFYDFPEYSSESVTLVGRGIGLGTAFARREPFGAIGRLLVLSAKSDSFDVGYLADYFNHKFRLHYESGGIPQLPGKTLGSYSVILPPFREQVEISNVLQTWDRAIETVKALIANARAQKQALMQQLLPQGTTPPKKRLPGFSGVWRETSLGSLGETYGGLTGKSKNDFGSGSPFITYKNVFENGFVDPKNVGLVKVGADERQHLIRNGDILFTTSSETPEEVGMSSVVIFETGAIYLNSFCFGFRPNSASAIRANFAGHFFRSPSMRRLISALAQGSTRYNISKSALLKLAFQLPNADEQDAIADVLGSCDSELLKLTGQLTALRQEKAALMQQLLTGKRRVKLPASEVA